MKTISDIPPYLNLSLEDMEGEIWKDIPDYIGTHKVSNYGRVKSLIKKRILGQYNNGHGYYSVNIMNRHQYVHRLVASAFCMDSKTADRNHVNHRDGNKANNMSSNLEYCTCKENSKHALENDLIPFVKIYQYDKNGNYMCTHKSVRDAAKSVNTTAGAIVGNCTGHTHLIKGFAFRYEKSDRIEVSKRQYKHILQYSLDGTFIREWDSAQQIQDELGIIKNNVVCNCLGKNHTCKGFIFKYK